MTPSLSERSRVVRISVVIPVLNEVGNIPELTRALSHVLTDLCSREGFSQDAWEIVFVDDGSRDDSWALIEERHRADPRVGGLRLSRQFGHHIAVTAGLDPRSSTPWNGSSLRR